MDKNKKYSKVFKVLNGELNYKVADTSKNELLPFINSMNSVSKSGLHNPFKNPERYQLLADVCFKSAHSLHDKNIEHQIVDESFLLLVKQKNKH